MSEDAKRPLGKILLQKKLVSQADLDAALRAQKRSADPHPQPLASQLAESGVLDELEALRALSEQHGVPGIDLAQIAILLEHLDLVPREVSESRLILCVLARGERLFLAMANPMDRRVIDEVEFVTGRKVYPYVALTGALRKTIVDAYDALAKGDTYFLGPKVPAETLRQLGLDSEPSPREELDHEPTPPSSAMAPGSPSFVVDEQIRDVGARAELATDEFGNLTADISSVMALPEELKVAPGRGGVPAPAQPTPAAGGAPPTQGAGKLVLVVDDEEEIRKLLQRLLVGKGFRVIEADRGQLALRMVKEHMPDAILLDAMLPEIHGFDIARRIKGSERYGKIPIIMISAVYKGWRIAEDLKTSYGIDEYLEKPFKITDVLAALSRVFAVAANAPPPEAPRDPEKLDAEAERALNEGIAAYKRGELDVAIDHLRRGVDIDPLAYRLHFHLALLYGKKGMIYEGIQELEKAVDLNPKHFAAQKNLAVLYEKAGFKHKAVEVWTRCAQIAPDEETRASVKQHLLELL